MKPPLQITIEQLNAINAAKLFFGRSWKTKLSECWRASRYPEALKPHASELQTLRNTVGSALFAAKELAARM